MSRYSLTLSLIAALCLVAIASHGAPPSSLVEPHEKRPHSEGHPPPPSFVDSDDERTRLEDDPSHPLELENLEKGLGAEEYDLWGIRERNLPEFNAFFSALSVSPHIALGAVRAYGGERLDRQVFGADEAAVKSPWSWFWFAVWPTSILIGYLKAFADTNWVLTYVLMATYALADLSLYVDIACMLLQPALRPKLVYMLAMRALLAVFNGAFYYAISAWRVDVNLYLALPFVVLLLLALKLVSRCSAARSGTGVGVGAGSGGGGVGKIVAMSLCLAGALGAYVGVIFFALSSSTRYHLGRCIMLCVFCIWLALQPILSLLYLVNIGRLAWTMGEHVRFYRRTTRNAALVAVVGAAVRRPTLPKRVKWDALYEPGEQIGYGGYSNVYRARRRGGGGGGGEADGRGDAAAPASFAVKVAKVKQLDLEHALLTAQLAIKNVFSNNISDLQEDLERGDSTLTAANDFLHEAKVMGVLKALNSRLPSPREFGFVDLVDFISADGVSCIVMKEEGRNLKDLIPAQIMRIADEATAAVVGAPPSGAQLEGAGAVASPPASVRSAYQKPHNIKLVQSICRAVAFLHRAGGVHRDIKPGNVVVDLRDSTVPILIDFGVSVFDGTGDRFSHGVGTEMYQPPELWSIHKEGVNAAGLNAGLLKRHDSTGDSDVATARLCRCISLPPIPGADKMLVSLANGSAADVWATALVCIELVTLTAEPVLKEFFRFSTAFQTETQMMLAWDAATTFQFMAFLLDFKRVDPHLVLLFGAMLSPVASRITMEEVIAHRWDLYGRGNEATAPPTPAGDAVADTAAVSGAAAAAAAPSTTAATAASLTTEQAAPRRRGRSGSPGKRVLSASPPPPPIQSRRGL